MEVSVPLESTLLGNALLRAAALAPANPGVTVLETARFSHVRRGAGVRTRDKAVPLVVQRVQQESISPPRDVMGAQIAQQELTKRMRGNLGVLCVPLVSSAHGPLSCPRLTVQTAQRGNTAAKVRRLAPTARLGLIVLLPRQ